MPRSAALTRRDRAVRASSRSPLGAAVTGLLGAGLGLVILPLILSRLPGLKALLGLQRLGWFLLLFGLVLLGYRLLLGRQTRTVSLTRPPFAPSSQSRPFPQSRPFSQSRPLSQTHSGRPRPRRRRFEEVSANLIPAASTLPPISELSLSAPPRTSPVAPPIAARPAVAPATPIEPPRSAPDAPPARPSAWGPEVLRVIEWRRFEALVEALFAQAGFLTRSQSHGADGGVDIWLHSKHQPDGSPVSIVQCKHWSDSKPVGVDKIRELRGVMAAHQIRRGQFACTARYTDAAREFARDNQIHLLDGAALLDLIAKRTPDQQQALLDVALEGEYWKPTCVNCGVKMVLRLPRNEGKGFWGCINYPRCRGRMNVRSE
jgi:restriction system protein